MTLAHEPRQHDEGVGCACGKDWPCPDAERTGRRAYLGGPDMAAVVGVSRFGSPISVWREKVEGSTRELTERMAWGQLLEDAIADGYTARTGRRLQKRHTPIFHRVYPFLGGSPDRWIVGEPGLVEMKVTARGWDEIPPDVEVQCQWYLGLTGRQFCDVVVLTGMSQLSISTIERDDKLIAELVDEGVDFWQQHVLTGEAPEVDASQDYRHYLAEKFPRDGGMEIVATAEQALLVDELRAVIAEQAEATDRRTLIENRLKAAIGEASGLIGADFRISWKAQSRRTVDWHQLARDLVEPLAVQAGVDGEEYLADKALAYTSADSVRVFRVSQKREAA